MKKEIRVIGIDDAPFDKSKKGNVLVVGTIFRGGEWMDGVLSTTARIDGTNSTSKLALMINKCKFKPQLQAILLNGIALGGFNIIDINKLNKKTKIPVIVVIRKCPDFASIKYALDKMGKSKRYRLIEKAGKVHKIGDVYAQFSGCDIDFVKEVLRITCTRSFLPEPLRAAHIIAAGIVLGESKGDA